MGRRTLKAENKRNAKSGKLNALKRSARTKSNSARARKALDIPHPGHGMPVRALNGQKIGRCSRTSFVEIPSM